MAKKIVTIQMDKERHMKIGMNALVQLEKEMGKPITEISKGVSMADLVSIFYIALKWEDKKLTKEITGDIMDDCIDEHGMDYLTEKMSEALSGAMGNGKALPSQ
ncbi:MAG: hypothetical protein WBA84_04000 [Carnobacterium sp.]|uniref:hypothetical protein n=1 Tax=Carnobacterium sp. TaxID=48221 RepID=UPI003C7754CB